MPALSLPPLLGNLGLLLFLYGVGIAYGAQFWCGLTSADGVRANIAATIAVLGALALTLAFVPGRSVCSSGLFALVSR